MFLVHKDLIRIWMWEDQGRSRQGKERDGLCLFYGVPKAE